ncbi:hypothetical protein EJD97_012651, partial [Solanum chilense]
ANLLFGSKMQDDDWDIGAVVKSCNINRSNNGVAPKLDFETHLNDLLNSFDALLAPSMTIFNGLSEIFSLDFPNAYQEKYDDQVMMINQNGSQQLYLNQIQPSHFIEQISFPPLPITVVFQQSTTTTQKEWIDVQQFDVGAKSYPNFTFSMKTPLIQTRTRKNQSISITYELLQEELTNDIWTWRKYGQKQIKDSPFPRNYYKCSTSKLCKAKKKIEKSPMDEKIFLVSYSDEHNHDPPTNRNNLASCNSNYKFKLPKGINIVPKTPTLSESNFSSKCVKHSSVIASPIITTMPPLEIWSKNKMIIASVEEKC